MAANTCISTLVLLACWSVGIMAVVRQPTANITILMGPYVEAYESALDSLGEDGGLAAGMEAVALSEQASIEASRLMLLYGTEITNASFNSVGAWAAEQGIENVTLAGHLYLVPVGECLKHLPSTCNMTAVMSRVTFLTMDFELKRATCDEACATDLASSDFIDCAAMWMPLYGNATLYAVPNTAVNETDADLTASSNDEDVEEAMAMGLDTIDGFFSYDNMGTAHFREGGFAELQSGDVAQLADAVRGAIPPGSSTEDEWIMAGGALGTLLDAEQNDLCSV